MTKLHEHKSNGKYQSVGGLSLKRDSNAPFRWRLIDCDGTLMCIDQYRNDIAERYSLKLIPTYAKEWIDVDEYRLSGPDATEMLHIIRQVYRDLPTKRDWLDPALESMMKDIVDKMEK